MSEYTITRKNKRILKRAFKANMSVKRGIQLVRNSSDSAHPAFKAIKNALQ